MGVIMGPASSDRQRIGNITKLLYEEDSLVDGYFRLI